MVESVDEELKAFFNMAGVSDNDFNDETRNFIYDFIANHGGLERAKQEITVKGATPPVPVKDASQTPRLQTTRSRPPPPPPQVPNAAPPPPGPGAFSARKTMVVESAGPSNPLPASDSRTDLLDQIKKGKELHEQVNPKESILYKKKYQNVPSSLLTQEENQKVFDALGKHSNTLATAVVHLCYSEKPNSSCDKKHSGVICFVRDCDRRSFFLKLFDKDKGCWVWEKEMDVSATYKSAFTFFHVFESKKCMAVLIFESNVEALDFKSAVQKKLQQREERKREKSESTHPVHGTKARRKKKLTKEDVSTVTNFKHVQHIKWHPVKGFDVEGVDDEELKAFFNMAGVSDNDLNDNEIRKFIFDFIEEQGGLERAKQEKHYIQEMQAKQEIAQKDKDKDTNEDEKDKDPKVKACHITSIVCGAEQSPRKFRP